MGASHPRTALQPPQALRLRTEVLAAHQLPRPLRACAHPGGTMTDLPVPSQPDLVLHMPCGCPYPKIGDHRPCEHGNNAYDDDVPSQPDRPRDCHWPDCKDSGACDFRGHRCAPSQPDRDTAFTAWSADLPFTWGFEETAFAAGWDAATRAEREP